MTLDRLTILGQDPPLLHNNNRLFTVSQGRLGTKAYICADSSHSYTRVHKHAPAKKKMEEQMEEEEEEEEEEKNF